MVRSTKIYANAVAKYNEGKLLDSEQIRRICEADFADALKIVTDLGYGGGVLGDKGQDVDAFIAEETARLIEFVISDSPDEWLSRALTNRFLYSNAKVYYKNKFTNVDLEAALYRMPGNDEIEHALGVTDYAALPACMADAFAELDARFTTEPADPKKIDLVLTRAMYADTKYCARKSGAKIIRSYVTAEIDLSNLLTVFRCRRLGLGRTDAAELLITGGTLAADDLLSAVDADEDEAGTLFSDTQYADLVSRLLSDGGGSLVRFQADTDAYLNEITNAERDNMLSLSPFLGYFTAKLAECKTVKMILTCLKNNARDEIARRLGRGYAL